MDINLPSPICGGVSSLLPPDGSQGSNSGSQAGWQAPLVAESFHLPHPKTFGGAAYSSVPKAGFLSGSGSLDQERETRDGVYASR